MMHKYSLVTHGTKILALFLVVWKVRKDDSNWQGREGPVLPQKVERGHLSGNCSQGRARWRRKGRTPKQNVGENPVRRWTGISLNFAHHPGEVEEDWEE